MKTFVLISLFALTSVGCGGPLEDAQAELGTATQEVNIAVSVPVGDPFRMVAAPAVSVAAQVGDTLTLTSSGPVCGLGCSYTWRNPDLGIPRYGGAILGYGQTLTVTESVAGASRITLEYCVKTSARFSRCIYTYVYVTTTAP